MIASALFWLAVYLMTGSAFCLGLDGALGGARMFRYAGALHGSAAAVAFILLRVLS